MSEETKQPDHTQAWIDLICSAAQQLSAEDFYRWLDAVGRGTDADRVRKGRAVLPLFGWKTPIPALNLGDGLAVPIVTSEHVDRPVLTPFSAGMVDALINDRQPLNAIDMAWAQRKARELGFAISGDIAPFDLTSRPWDDSTL